MDEATRMLGDVVAAVNCRDEAIPTSAPTSLGVGAVNAGSQYWLITYTDPVAPA